LVLGGFYVHLLFAAILGKLGFHCVWSFGIFLIAIFTGDSKIC
jgi:hypothetical protein